MFPLRVLKRSFSQPFMLLPAMLLAVTLLCAQFATLEHGLEHLSHDTSELCQTFIGFEKNLPLMAAVITSAAFLSAVLLQRQQFESAVIRDFFAYFSRAPPISA